MADFDISQRQYKPWKVQKEKVVTCYRWMCLYTTSIKLKMNLILDLIYIYIDYKYIQA
jgi:hypothetical protein